VLRCFPVCWPVSLCSLETHARIFCLNIYLHWLGYWCPKLKTTVFLWKYCCSWIEYQKQNWLGFVFTAKMDSFIYTWTNTLCFYSHDLFWYKSIINNSYMHRYKRKYIYF
jgi:hypothetical protein